LSQTNHRKDPNLWKDLEELEVNSKRKMCLSFWMVDLIIWCQHKWKTKQINLTPISHDTGLRNYPVHQGSPGEFSPYSARCCCRGCHFQTVFLRSLCPSQCSEWTFLLSSSWISEGLRTASLSLHSWYFVAEHALLCRNGLWQTPAELLKLLGVCYSSLRTSLCFAPQSCASF